MDLSSVQWRKSSYSGPEGDCIEVAWRKSSFSGPEECVEVAFRPGEVGVRDSKNPTGGALVLPETAWQAFRATAAS